MRFFWGIWIGLDFSSHMGVSLGHVINMDYKFLIGENGVESTASPPLLFLEVSLLKVLFSAVCGLFGGL